MNQYDTIVEKLKRQGHRLTAVRLALVQIFTGTEQPQTASELLERLRQKLPRVHKTTLYRELDFLTKEDVIREVSFEDAVVRYEMNKDHHHHLVCEICHRIEEVEVEGAEEILKKVEKQLGRTSQFRSIRHSMEFFGVCRTCHI